MRFHFIPVLFFLIFIFAKVTYAQQGKIIINGKIIGDDKQPVAYANINIPKKGLGTISNINGDFLFTIPSSSSADSLVITCIGFNTKTIAVLNLIVAERPKPTITLSKSNTPLQEVSIAYRDPMKIIQKAIDRIPENYINTPHVIRGFYRETTMKDKTPLQLSEAVFDIFNYGYADKREDLFKLVKARDDKNERDFKGIEVGQKPRGIFNDDIVKRLQTSDILGKDGIKRHSYEVAGIADFKGRPAYEIDFSEKSSTQDRTFRGKVFIDTKSYAFVYFDYSASPETMRQDKVGNFAERMLMKMMGMEIAIKADRDRISYQNVNGKWVLAQDVGDTKLYFKLPARNYDFTADIKFNYIVTAVDTTQTTPFHEKMRSNEHINDHDTNEGEEFWKDYNIILPDFDTEALIKQINAINAVVRLKTKFEAKELKLPKAPVLRLDSMLTYYHANGQFNGAALVKSKGKVILNKSYGFADQQKQLPGNEHTAYRIGSAAKTFTSLVINQLVSERKLDVHVPIKTYIPYYVHGDVTIEQLLTHQSGIPEYFNNDDYKLELLTKSFTLKDMVLKFCSDTLQFKSGTGFEYSNSNFAVLALIAQEVAGKPFETLLRDRVFTSLQMTDTYFGKYKGNENRAIGYSDGLPEQTYDYGNVYGAGGIWSSAADLLKYHDGLLANKLLPLAQKTEMLKPRVEFKDYGAMYDYGWMTDKSAFAASQKHVITYHPGTDLGFFTMYVRQEDTDSCIILLNNTGEFPRYDMIDLILNIIN